MRYRFELEIEVPRERVVELFSDEQNLYQWQPDLVSFESLDGDKARDVGSRTRQIHRMGKREIEMIETITVHDPPERYSATYEADGIWNLIENHFVNVDDQRTRWILDSEFNCSGIVIRLMTIFAPGMFKRQTMTFMQRFKEFAEKAGRK